MSVFDVRVTTNVLLPSGCYALTKGDKVVWDSVTRQPPDLPNDPSRWDGVMVSPDVFERMKRESRDG